MPTATTVEMEKRNRSAIQANISLRVTISSREKKFNKKKDENTKFPAMKLVYVDGSLKKN